MNKSGMNPQQLVSAACTLVSLPEVAHRISEVVNDPNSSANDIGQVITGDPNLTARLLRMANSPVYMPSSPIETVSRAVALMGANQIRDLALGISATRALNGLPSDLVSMDTFWMHSLYCGVIADLLAERCSDSSTEALFVAGLLHDIGQLVMFNKLPEKSREALLLSVDDPAERPMDAIEREVFGFDHCQIGAELAKVWSLPAKIRACIAWHHDPTAAPEFPSEAALVHIANSLAVLAELDSADLADAPPVDSRAWELTGLSPELVGDTIQAAQEQFGEIKRSFMM